MKATQNCPLANYKKTKKQLRRNVLVRHTVNISFDEYILCTIFVELFYCGFPLAIKSYSY